MRPLLALSLALIAGLVAPAQASTKARQDLQMVRLALSTGRWAAGSVANGVEPLKAYRNMLGYTETGRDLLSRYELPEGWVPAIELVLALPGPVLPGAEDEEALDGAQALAITYARAAALERALPRRVATPEHRTPAALRRVLLEVASAVPVDVDVVLQARTLAQGARFVADVAAEHDWAGHPAAAARLRAAADGSRDAEPSERLRFLQVVLSSHRDPILDGRDLARDTIRAFFEIPGHADDARRVWQLAVLEGVYGALIDHLSAEDPARVKLKQTYEDSYEWDPLVRAEYLERHFWYAGGI